MILQPEDSGKSCKWVRTIKGSETDRIISVQSPAENGIFLLFDLWGESVIGVTFLVLLSGSEVSENIRNCKATWDISSESLSLLLGEGN